MTANTATPLAVFQRRRAIRMMYWNGALWAIGNGLASTTLVVYLALELDAERIGLGIGLILAMRHIVGVLRLIAPVLIDRLVDRKRFCLGSYLLGSLLLLGLPLVAAPGLLPSAAASLWALVGLWCAYHLLQYLGTIALWSWLADLVPLRIRGRFLGRRNRWMAIGEAAAMLAGGLFVWLWLETHPQSPRWIAYAVSAVLGSGLMLAAPLPLLAVPALAVGRGATFHSMLAPFCDARFLRLVLFGCWFSFFNGVTQSAQNIYPIRALGIGLFVMLAAKTGMRCGQAAISPWLGRLADRLGNRPVMVGSLLLVATGPLFFLFATPERWWWVLGAWVVWIAYAGLNICLPNLMLKLSPRESNTPYIATYFTLTGLCYAASTVAGGALWDRYGETTWAMFRGTVVLDFYQCSFLFGWITRSLGVLVLLRVIEDRGGPVGARTGR